MHLTPLRPVVERPGPFVTVHAQVGHPTEDARQQLEARWTTIRHALEHEGVDEAVVSQLHDRLDELPDTPGLARRTIVAQGGDIVFDEVLAGDVRWPETVDVSTLPDVGGWLVQADRQIPFMLVVADREGADISLYHGSALPVAGDVEVQGDDFQLSKVAGGGWAHRRIQQYAEDTWRRNAEEVAEVVRKGVRTSSPHLVVLAGDERARHAIQEALDGVLVPLVHVESGGRAAGASEEALWDEVGRTLAEFEAHRDAQVVAELAQRTGQGSGAAQGLDEVLASLVKGQVERLVIDLEAARELEVDPADHEGLPLPVPVAGPQPADRVLLAAAAATDAECTVLPREVTDGPGVAALLRWDE
jgi:Bacterial archaeo-eukaryotic release factor family 2